MARREPPGSFFRALTLARREAFAELAALGYSRPIASACLPHGDWVDGWWSCRGISATAEKENGMEHTIEKVVDARSHARRVRRVKPFDAGRSP